MLCSVTQKGPDLNQAQVAHGEAPRTNSTTGRAARPPGPATCPPAPVGRRCRVPAGRSEHLLPATPPHPDQLLSEGESGAIAHPVRKVPATVQIRTLFPSRGRGFARPLRLRGRRNIDTPRFYLRGERSAPLLLPARAGEASPATPPRGGVHVARGIVLRPVRRET
jgi:hypothetical protein